MKKVFIIILGILLITSCERYFGKSNYQIIKEQTEVIDSLKTELQKVIIENETYKYALNNSDSIKIENFILKYKINRIKQYDSIVIRNSSQSKYFRGWVRRVIYE